LFFFQLIDLFLRASSDSLFVWGFGFKESTESFTKPFKFSLHLALFGNLFLDIFLNELFYCYFTVLLLPISPSIFTEAAKFSNSVSFFV
jgi:hypothetical protein